MRDLIDRWDVTLRKKINRGDAPYGRDDTIEAVIFQEGVDCDRFADEKAHRWIDDDFSEKQDRAMCYAVSRVASICKLWDPDLYEARTAMGYYGEEVRGVTHHNESTARERIQKCQNLVREGDIREMVEQLLTWEYGYVLDEIQKADFSEEQVSISKLHTPNKRYAGKVDPAEYTVSTDWAIGVYLDREVIDGYNRYASLKGSADDVFIYNFTT